MHQQTNTRLPRHPLFAIDPPFPPPPQTLTSGQERKHARLTATSTELCAGVIYCTPVTARLLTKDMGIPRHIIHPLPLDLPTLIEGAPKDDIPPALRSPPAQIGQLAGPHRTGQAMPARAGTTAPHPPTPLFFPPLCSLPKK